MNVKIHQIIEKTMKLQSIGHIFLTKKTQKTDNVQLIVQLGVMQKFVNLKNLVESFLTCANAYLQNRLRYN